MYNALHVSNKVWVGFLVSPTQPKKEVPNMIPLLKYLLRFIISLCITIAVIFVMACVIAVIYFAIRGDIKIHRISGDEEIK